MEMQPIDRNRPMTIELPAEQWNVIVLVLRKFDMPYDTSAPIISSMTNQLQQQAMMSTESVVEELDVSNQDNR